MKNNCKKIFFIIKKHRWLIFFVFSAILVIPSWISFAQQPPASSLYLSYPTLVPGVAPPHSVQTYLPLYIRYLYTGAIALGGLIGFFALLRGGLTYLTSTGNPGKMRDAREQIIYGLLGLLIIFGSYVTLHEINPELTQIRLPHITPFREGIIVFNADCATLKKYASGDETMIGLPELLNLPKGVHYLSITNTQTGGLKWPGGAVSGLRKAKSFFTFHSSDELSLVFYEKPNPTSADKPAFSSEQDLVGAMKERSCYDFPKPLDIQAVKFNWYRPGVWLFTYNTEDNKNHPPDPRAPWDGCKQKPCYTYLKASSPTLPNGLSDHVKAIAFVKDRLVNQRNFGAILHNIPGEAPKERGWAQIFLPDAKKDITVYSLKKALHASSITIFQIPKDNTELGNGNVILCKNPRCAEQRYGNKYYTPQLSIGWNSSADLKLKNITSNVYNHASATAYTADHNEKLEHQALSKYTFALVGAILKLPGIPWKDKNGGAIKGGSSPSAPSPPNQNLPGPSKPPNLNPNPQQPMMTPHGTPILPQPKPSAWSPQENRSSFLSSFIKTASVFAGGGPVVTLYKDDGVSAVYFDPKDQYIVLLYRSPMSVAKIVDDLSVDADALLNSIADLSTVGMNDRPAAVVVVRARLWQQ